eukprot:XP_001707316.1 Hypothetical protein GL50803_34418 [Giardia lamblia ATCC 50803]
MLDIEQHGTDHVGVHGIPLEDTIRSVYPMHFGVHCKYVSVYFAHIFHDGLEVEDNGHRGA